MRRSLRSNNSKEETGHAPAATPARSRKNRTTKSHTIYHSPQQNNSPTNAQSMMMNSTTFDQLPYCIFHLIREYISQNEYRNFMNTSIELLQDIKRETVYYNLNYASSKRYSSVASFRNYLLRNVAKKSKQISLNFGVLSEFSQRMQVQGVHKCSIGHFSLRRNARALNMDIFSSIEELSLSRFDRIVSFDGMVGVKKLFIDRLDNLTSVASLTYLYEVKIVNCPKLTDILALGAVHTVKIEKLPELRDISQLGRGNHTLSLIDCPEIYDISSLGNVHSLTIIRCPKVTDVSKLLNVVNLNLTDCPNIDDIRGLGQQATLILGPCQAKDYSMLKDVSNCVLISCDINDLSFLENEKGRRNSSRSVMEQFSFSTLSNFEEERSNPGFMLLYCESISNVSYLRNMHYVTIGGNALIDDVSSLGNVHHLSLFGCPKIVSLKGLGKLNHFIDITDCDGITDFSPLQNVHSVEINSCTGLKTAEDLKSVHYLTIESCDELVDIRPLSEIKHLKLIKCDGIINLDNLSRVPVIEVKQCAQLRDISGLGKNDQVTIERCNKITNISSLKYVKKVRIIKCFQIDDVSELRGTVASLQFEPADFISFGFLNIFFM